MAGEIDVTRPALARGSDPVDPRNLSHIKGVGPGQHRLNFLAGKKEAELVAGRLLGRLRQKPLGTFKARIMRRLIKVHRSLIGIREHPKYFIVQNFDMIKQAILQEAAQLVKAGILLHPEEVFWLSLREIKEVIATQLLISVRLTKN